MHTNISTKLTGTLPAAAFFLAVAFVGLATISMPLPAHAAGVTLVTCEGTHTAAWTPGLTNTAATVTVSTKSLWSCPLSSTSATSMQNFSQELSCQSLLQPTSVTWEIIWANKQTSIVNLTGDVENVDGNLVVPLTGKVSSGLYNGATVAITITDTNLGGTLDSACTSAGGLTNASGPTTLTITNL